MSIFVFSVSAEKKDGCEYSLDITLHKSVRIRSYSGPHFPALGLNMERYGVSLRIQSECGKMQTRIIPKMDVFLPRTERITETNFFWK